MTMNPFEVLTLVPVVLVGCARSEPQPEGHDVARGVATPLRFVRIR